MLDFFGGVPKHIYLDNSTSLVLKADKYNPKICNEYREFCDYYGTIPVAVRPGKPKDKAAVENAVRWVQVKILSNLHSQKFFDINELNAAMLKELDRFNRHTLTTRTDGFSRWDLMQEERSALRPMPPMPYELSSVSKILNVQKNSVVRLNNLQNPSFSAWLFKVSAQRSETEGALASKNENTSFVAARAWCELVHRADLSTALKAAHPT